MNFEEMKKKYGNEGLGNIIEFIMDILISEGDNNAKCLKQRKEIGDTLGNIFKKYVMDFDSNNHEDIVLRIEEILIQINSILKDLEKNLEEIKNGRK